MRIWQPLTLSLYGLRQWGIPTRQWGIWYQHKHFDLFTERFHARGEDRPERLDVGVVTAHESWMLYICSLHATTVQSAQLISFLCRHPPSWPWTQRPGHRGWTWTRTPTPLRASTRQHQRTLLHQTKNTRLSNWAARLTVVFGHDFHDLQLALQVGCLDALEGELLAQSAHLLLDLVLLLCKHVAVLCFIEDTLRIVVLSCCHVMTCATIKTRASLTTVRRARGQNRRWPSPASP